MRNKQARPRRNRKIVSTDPLKILQDAEKGLTYRAIPFAIFFPPDEVGGNDLVGKGTCMQGYNDKGEYVLKDDGGNVYIDGRLLVIKD